MLHAILLFIINSQISTIQESLECFLPIFTIVSNPTMLMRVLVWKHETFRFVHLLICNGQKKKVLLCKMKHFHICLSTGRGGNPLDRDPPLLVYGKERAVRILLQCILVSFDFMVLSQDQLKMCMCVKTPNYSLNITFSIRKLQRVDVFLFCNPFPDKVFFDDCKSCELLHCNILRQNLVSKYDHSLITFGFHNVPR